jgi:hypothetical protein
VEKVLVFFFIKDLALSYLHLIIRLEKYYKLNHSNKIEQVIMSINIRNSNSNKKKKKLNIQKFKISCIINQNLFYRVSKYAGCRLLADLSKTLKKKKLNLKIKIII